MQYTVNLCSCLLKSLHSIQRNPLSWAWIRTLYYQMSIPPSGQGVICREKTNFFIANPIKTILSLTTLFQSRGLSPIPLPTTNHTLYIWMIYIWMKTSRGTELHAETRASQYIRWQQKLLRKSMLFSKLQPLPNRHLQRRHWLNEVTVDYGNMCQHSRTPRQRHQGLCSRSRRKLQHEAKLSTNETNEIIKCYDLHPQIYHHSFLATWKLPAKSISSNHTKSTCHFLTEMNMQSLTATIPSFHKSDKT